MPLSNWLRWLRNGKRRGKFHENFKLSVSVNACRFYGFQVLIERRTTYLKHFNTIKRDPDYSLFAICCYSYVLPWQTLDWRSRVALTICSHYPLGWPKLRHFPKDRLPTFKDVLLVLCCKCFKEWIIRNSVSCKAVHFSLLRFCLWTIFGCFITSNISSSFMIPYLLLSNTKSYIFFITRLSQRHRFL